MQNKFIKLQLVDIDVIRHQQKTSELLTHVWNLAGCYGQLDNYNNVHLFKRFDNDCK